MAFPKQKFGVNEVIPVLAGLLSADYILDGKMNENIFHDKMIEDNFFLNCRHVDSLTEYHKMINPFKNVDLI